MREDEMVMLNEHDKIIKTELIPTINENILPRLTNVEIRQESADKEYTQLKNQVTNMMLNQQDLKNTVTGYGNDNKELLRQMIGHILTVDKDAKDIKGKVELTKVAAEGNVATAKLSRSEKIWVAGITGLMTALGSLNWLVPLIAKLFQ